MDEQNDATDSTSETSMEERLAAVEAELEALKATYATPFERPAGSDAPSDSDKISIVVYSGSLDRILATLNIATGAAAMGIEVNLFFTFWATAALRKPEASRKRTFLERALGAMQPAGRNKLKLSNLHMGGLGTAMIKWRMRSKQFADADQLFQMAQELGVGIAVCDMSMDLLGMKMEDLIDYPDMGQCGVATFLSHAMDSKTCLFV